MADGLAVYVYNGIYIMGILYANLRQKTNGLHLIFSWENYE